MGDSALYVYMHMYTLLMDIYEYSWCACINIIHNYNYIGRQGKEKIRV